MIEQMKNKNEYREGENLYVKKIKSSKCCVKIDDRYIITCNIHQRGRHEYSFYKGDKWITKLYSERKLWLSPDAETTILREVELFDERLNSLMGEGSRAITMEDAKLSVFLTGFSGKLDAAIKYDNEDTKQTITELHIGNYFEEILHRLQFLRTLRDCESKELLQNVTKTTFFYLTQCRKRKSLMIFLNAE